MIAGAWRATPPSRCPLTQRAATAVLLALPLGLMAPASWALEVNSASRAELEQLRGLGPAKVERLLSERDRAIFASWQDLARRVPGFGAKTSAALSREGLSVNQQAFNEQQSEGPRALPSR